MRTKNELNTLRSQIDRSVHDVIKDDLFELHKALRVYSWLDPDEDIEDPTLKDIVDLLYKVSDRVFSIDASYLDVLNEYFPNHIVLRVNEKIINDKSTGKEMLKGLEGLRAVKLAASYLSKDAEQYKRCVDRIPSELENEVFEDEEDKSNNYLIKVINYLLDLYYSNVANTEEDNAE